jgi:succinate semialdehyde reductase
MLNYFTFDMHTVRIPKVIKFGKNALSETEYPKKALVVTTATPDLSSKWLDKMGIQDYMLFDKVTPEPSIDDVKSVISEYKNKNPSVLIGLGGGSSMDVVKYAAPELGKEKILIPTTFGTGAEMTTYCVLKFDGKKKLLREDRFLADMAVVDSYFMAGTPDQIIKNSVCDACAQATEGYDSKLGNDFTRTMCKEAFEVLYDAIMNDKPENYPYGSMLSGIGFGNCSTTLGHALSYVFSNEGVPHGYSLSSCTTVAHKFNKSIFYQRFKEIVKKLGFERLTLKEDVSKAADTIMTDRGHLDPNPIPVTKQDVIKCLEDIKAGNL